MEIDQLNVKIDHLTVQIKNIYLIDLFKLFYVEMDIYKVKLIHLRSKLINTQKGQIGPSLCEPF